MTAPTVAPAAGWAPELRQAGEARFAEVGFPTTRHEEWRFTPVQRIAQGTFAEPVAAAADPAALAPYLFGQGSWPQVVFVNGRYDAARSSLAGLPAGVTVSSLQDAWLAGTDVVRAQLGRHATPAETPFTALNAARLHDGAFVHVPAGVALPQPVHLVYVTTAEAAGAQVMPRTLVVVGREGRAALVESYVSLAPGATYFVNPVTEVVTAEGCWVEHVRLQRESEAAYHVGFTSVDQARDSHYRSFTLAVGGAIARHDLVVRLQGTNTETLMYGLYLARGEQLVDNHTTIHHQQPACRSWEVYKGVLDGRSRGVFNGKIYVTPEAQKTDAKQTNRALLLSPDAKVDTKPQLEIFADDVKCTHGATVGYLDNVTRFYLQSRGIPAALATRMLTYAFCAEVVEEIAIEPVRAEVDRLVRERIGGLGA